MLGVSERRGISQDTPMKPRRPAIKDSTHRLREATQVAARAARKREVKRRKLESEPHFTKEDGNLAIGSVSRCLCG